MSHRRRGFTLIELLVVVAIIALLIAILLPSLGRARAKTKLVKCQVFLRNMYQGINVYQSEYDGTMLPCQTSGGYNGVWYSPTLLGSTYGKGMVGMMTANNEYKSATAWLPRTMRCPDTEPCLVDWYKIGPTADDPGGVPGELDNRHPQISVGGEMLGATDVDHGTYTYNRNFGYGSNPRAPKFVSIPKTTLVSLESHGGADKGEFDWNFASVDELVLMPNPAIRKGGKGVTPLAGRPHLNGKAANMLFMDGQIITDDPFKMTPAAHGWLVNFRLSKTGPFPY